MIQPRSIRFHLSAVFIFFFLLIIVLGMFSISRLRDFNNVSASIADLWLPTTRVLGDLNNFTSDFRAAEGSDLLSSNASELAAIEMEMAELDRSISQAQYSYEHLRHEADESDLYARFRASWHDYREIVNRVLELSRRDRKADAVNLYMTNSRWAYTEASDALGQLTKQSVGKAQEASARVAVAYQQASLLINIAMGIGGVLVVAALLYIGRSISNPLLHLASCMHRLAANDTDIVIKGTERPDEIGEMARAAVVFRNNAIELMVSSARARAAGLDARGKAHRRAASDPDAAQLRVDGLPRVSHPADDHRRPRPAADQDRLPAADRRDQRACHQGPRRRAADDPPHRQPAQLVPADRRRSRALFPSAGVRPARAAARDLPAPPRDCAGIPDRRELRRRRACRWSATPSCCRRCSTISSPTP